MNWYLDVLKKYAVFNGRASRSEFWYFTLFNSIVIIFLLIIGRATDSVFFDALYTLYILAVLLPSIGVEIRRLHDTGRSGWWLLIALIPIVSLILLVFWIQDGEPGTNQYGPNPKMPSPTSSLQ